MKQNTTQTFHVILSWEHTWERYGYHNAGVHPSQLGFVYNGAEWLRPKDGTHTAVMGASAQGCEQTVWDILLTKVAQQMRERKTHEVPYIIYFEMVTSTGEHRNVTYTEKASIDRGSTDFAVNPEAIPGLNMMLRCLLETVVGVKR